MKLAKIYGERNTNTNYLGELIKLNLDIMEIPGVVPRKIMRIQAPPPAKNLLRDIYFGLTFYKNLGWKHSRVKSEEVLKKYSLVKSNDVIFLTITKNPYSWLLSLYRRPYHQYFRVKPSFETFLETPWETVNRDNLRGPVTNPIELWNIKNRSYLNLHSLKKINLTSENIFEDAKGVIDRISSEFSVNHLNDKFANFDESTKYEGKDSNYYRDFYLKEKWKENLSDEAIAIINRHLDRSLMEYFGYEFLQQ